MIGTTLSHFRILAKIGEGGMGVVYRAEYEKLRRQVALKVLPPDLVGNEERRLRFLREARAAAAVTHPNIATIYEVGEADGVVFIVTANRMAPGIVHDPGSRIGPHEIVSKIGAGGMGEVYKAWDTRLDRAVAIKSCRPISRTTRQRSRASLRRRKPSRRFPIQTSSPSSTSAARGRWPTASWSFSRA